MHAKGAHHKMPHSIEGDALLRVLTGSCSTTHAPCVYCVCTMLTIRGQTRVHSSKKAPSQTAHTTAQNLG